MAGSTVILDSTGATVTATVGIPGGKGAHRSATYYFDVTAITGTWEIQANWSPTGVVIPIALASTVTTTGLKLLDLQSPFTLTNRAVPSPDTVTYTETVAGTLAGKLIAVYGD